MTPNPLVSIVVLNYNYGHYLSQCLDSALNQQHANIEVIAVDDGSSDHSAAVLKLYADRVKVCFKANGGMVSTMNRGFAESRGTIVMFLDADDFLLPDAVATHVAALSDTQVVRSQVYMTVLHGSVASREEIPDRAAPDGDLRELMLRRGPGSYVSAPNSGNAWSREFLERVMPLPEQPRTIGAETYLMDAAPLFGKVAVLRQPAMAAYRLHHANMNGAIEAMTPGNIRRIIQHFDARMAWLTHVATARGLLPETSEWLPRNWRLLTLQYLNARISGQPRVSLMRHLRPTLDVQGSAIKRQVLAIAILLVRALPLPLSLSVAGRIVRPRHM